MVVAAVRSFSYRPAFRETRATVDLPAWTFEVSVVPWWDLVGRFRKALSAGFTAQYTMVPINRHEALP